MFKEKVKYQLKLFWISHDMCDKSLATLYSRLYTQFNVLISSQALNDRYNKYSVKFVREVFNDMMINQNEVLQIEKKI